MDSGSGGERWILGRGKVGSGCGGGGRWGLRRGKVDSGTERMDCGLVLPLRVPKTHSCIVPPEPTTRPRAPVVSHKPSFEHHLLREASLETPTPH